MLALATLLLAAIAAAQSSSSTVSLILPYNDPQTFLASVIAAVPSATTYEITCAPQTTDYCGPAFTVTQGPSVWEMQYSVPGELSVSAHCNLVGSSSATCTESIGGSMANTQGVETSVLVSSDFESIWMPVTVTAGVGKLVAQTTGGDSASATGVSTSASSASTGEKTGTRATVASTASITKVTGSTTGSATGSASAAAQSTGAAERNLVKGAVVGAAGVLVAALAL
ncbi:hypothetical protein K432DRAFT_439118 [Lepidopterella palustris CBS 459.81]|uniref:GPI anchored protein n=1 Tax=Lepidopterella palustris CBS 459.81 TaxID=1314670 RepID=A0A8E2ELH3_9PEZI|nr:hypothetical protein K432DRAFT_439118 [Lepidopterella palustris CBS 459.81]